MPDFSSVPVVLLTRAADAAGRAATVLGSFFAPNNPTHSDLRGEFLGEFLADGWPEEDARVLAASGPDHWRAVEATFRKALAEHGPDHPTCREDCSPYCQWLHSLRPLAEQVLRDLGETV